MKKGDKVWINFAYSKPEKPEYEIYEVLDDGELFRLRHIETGSIQKSLVRIDRLVKSGV